METQIKTPILIRKTTLSLPYHPLCTLSRREKDYTLRLKFRKTFLASIFYSLPITLLSLSFYQASFFSIRHFISVLLVHVVIFTNNYFTDAAHIHYIYYMHYSWFESILYSFDFNSDTCIMYMTYDWLIPKWLSQCWNCTQFKTLFAFESYRCKPNTIH